MSLIDKSEIPERVEHFINDEKALTDGKLVSPIDLSLGNVCSLTLPRLNWLNMDEPPATMKLTNSGRTVIVSGKWVSGKRPYLFGANLVSKYVFSHIHFHWGSHDHEGSEHTIDGTCLPMEMHAVYFKARYLTQEAASKKDDGLVIAVYFVKLMNKTTPCLRWLATHLGSVVEPQTSAELLPCPLSYLICPFIDDYLMYWGSLVSARGCSHTTLWLVSRAALGVNVDDLNIFRRTIISRKEAMNKYLRDPNGCQERTVFHVNASAEKKHVLLPGTYDPSHVSYSDKPPLSPAQARRIFNDEEYTEDNDISTLDDKCKNDKLVKGTAVCRSSQNNDQCHTVNIKPPSQKITNTTFCNDVQIGPNSSSRARSFSPRLTNREIFLKNASVQKVNDLSNRRFERHRKDETENEKVSKNEISNQQQQHQHTCEDGSIGSLPVNSPPSSLGSARNLSKKFKGISSEKTTPNTVSIMYNKTKKNPSKLPLATYNIPRRDLQSSIPKMSKTPAYPYYSESSKNKGLNKPNKKGSPPNCNK